MGTPQTHKLGFGNGTIRENGDGTASYYMPLAFTQTLRVRISDISGFVVTGSGKVMTRTFKIMGNGTELASTEVNHGAAEKIEAWFRAHPDFASATRPAPAQASPQLDGRLVADELVKLAGLRDSGVLTEDEFAAQKGRLLG